MKSRTFFASLCAPSLRGFCVLRARRPMSVGVWEGEAGATGREGAGGNEEEEERKKTTTTTEWLSLSPVRQQREKEGEDPGGSLLKHEAGEEQPSLPPSSFLSLRLIARFCLNTSSTLLHTPSPTPPPQQPCPRHQSLQRVKVHAGDRWSAGQRTTTRCSLPATSE